MRFERLRLSNFKCYADTDVDLSSGVTVIHGLNGSGKSSLLEACFFALYGARALDQTLDELVSIGAEQASVELWFTHDGGRYRIERELKRRGDSVQTTTCLLEGEDETIEGARDVRSTVTDLLRMDASAFVNCAYVQQGEVNKLINASPSQRQDMIDDLLQLGKLEAYRERASDARVGIGRVRDDKRGALKQLDEQIEQRDAEGYHEQLNALKGDLAEVHEQIERYEQNRDRAETTRDDAQEILDEYEQRREELAEIEREIETLTKEIREAERERSDLGDQLTETRERREERRDAAAELLAETDIDGSPDDIDGETLSSRLDELREERETLDDRINDQRLEIQRYDSQAETARERADELASETADRRETAAELETELESTREEVAETREQIETLDERIAETEAVFDDAPVGPDDTERHRESAAEELTACREEVTAAETRLQSARETLSETEELLDAGKCPECGQSVDGAPHVETVDEDREAVARLETKLEQLRDRRDEREAELDRAESLADAADELDRLREERDQLETLVEERERGVDETAERIEELREEATELETQAETRRETANEADEQAAAARERMGELNREIATLKEQIDRVESLAEIRDDTESLTDELETLRERRQSLADQNELRNERLTEKRERRDELESQVDEAAIENAKSRKREAEEYLDEVEPQLDELETRRGELQEQIGRLKTSIEELESLRERRDELAETVAQLDELYAETERLQTTYTDLRAELRRQNLQKLERMVNETFELVYGNDAYSHIELDGEYELTVYQKDGDPLDPEQLSGGERAVFNLSLRCAIYRLLAEGIDGTAPLPPLILDEPTVFLDSGHVSRLVDLIESMTELGVAQILVVSHDDELVTAADELLTVEKDSTTNRSTVEGRDAVDASALSAFN